MKWLTVIAIALFVLLFGAQNSATAQNCPGGSFPMRPGDDLQALVNVAGANAAFCLEAGTYRRASIAPLDGQQFIASGAVIFDGEGVTEIAFNGVRTQDDPARNAENVTLRGIEFRNYRTSNYLSKSVLIPDAGWVIENVIIRDSTSGIRGGNVNWTCANGFILRDVLIENISHAALFWNATYGVTERLRVFNSGWQMPLADSNWYGIVKYQNQNLNPSGKTCPVVSGQSLVIRDSVFERLNGVGWWCDINCRDLEFRGNIVRDNFWSGLMFEISGGGHSGNQSNVIEGNTFSCNRNGRNTGGAWGGAEIFIPNSYGIIVRNNDITVCDGGRAFSLVYEDYRKVNTQALIEGNTIRVPGAASNRLIVIEGLEGRLGNIVWRDNRYLVDDVLGAYFQWAGGKAWSAFRDVTGETGTFAHIAQPTVDPSLPTLTPSATVTPRPTNTPAPPTLTPTPRPASYAIPAVIEAEDFHAALDNGAGNFFNTNARPDHPNVDIKSTSNGYAIGLFEGGEWFEVVADVPVAAVYSISFIGGSAESGRGIFVTVNGSGVGTIPAPALANWSAPYQTSTALVVLLNAGQVRLRFAAAPGFVDVDRIVIQALGTATPQPPTLVPTWTHTSTVTSSPVPTFTSTPTQSVTEVTVSPAGTATLTCYIAILNEYMLGELCLEAR